MNIIAIDCGASFIKGALMKDSKAIRRSCRQAPGICKDTEIFEPNKIETLMLLVREMIIELSQGLAEVCLCIANEMHGFVLAGKEGEPYTDYISWQHEFGRDSAESLKDERYADAVLHTGMWLRTGLPVCSLLELSRNGHLDQREEVFFYTLGDYLLKRLSAQEPVCHPTNAAATGLYDLRTGTWSQELIKAAGACKVRFPQIGNSRLTFQMNGTTITAKPAVGDQQAALYGAGLADENEISFNIGTGAQVSRITRLPAVSKYYQIRPYLMKDVYLKTVPHLPAGRALNVYIRWIREILDRFGCKPEDDKIWEVLLEEEKTAVASHLQCDLGFFENAATGHTFGAITQIGEYDLTLGNLMHTAFKQMADDFLRAADRIGADRGKITKVIFSGGIAVKIEKIRSYILEDFPKDLDVYLAADETLVGLERYGRDEGK